MGATLPPLVLVATIAIVLAVPALVYGIRGTRDPERLSAARNLLDPSRVSTGGTLLGSAAPPVEFGEVEAALHRLMLRILPEGVVESVRKKASAAGLGPRWPLGRVLLAKVALALLLLLIAVVSVVANPNPRILFVAVIAPLAGFQLVDVRLSGLATERRLLIQMALADTLDMMTVTVEAGIGFEAAMVRAARGSEGPLAEEILRTMQDIQTGMPRLEALRALADRVDEPDLTGFVTALSQAERYGVSLARVLRVQSGELRERRRQRAEERAMKIPVKIVLPLGTCILPAMMVLLVGPAVVIIARSFAAF